MKKTLSKIFLYRPKNLRIKIVNLPITISFRKIKIPYRRCSCLQGYFVSHFLDIKPALDLTKQQIKTVDNVHLQLFNCWRNYHDNVKTLLQVTGPSLQTFGQRHQCYRPIILLGVGFQIFSGFFTCFVIKTKMEAGLLVSVI